MGCDVNLGKLKNGMDVVQQLALKVVGICCFVFVSKNLLYKGPGKYFYETTVTDEGLCRVGWSTQQVCFIKKHSYTINNFFCL